MIANDENLEIIFTIADANKDGSLSIEEFTKTFSKYMKKDDCLALFLAVDIDKSEPVLPLALAKHLCGRSTQTTPKGLI